MHEEFGEHEDEGKHTPGISAFTASVTVNVVISNLSAAGSRMVPRTDCMLYLRARYPSTLGTKKRAQAGAFTEHTKKGSGTKSVRPAYTSSPVAR